MLWQWSPRILSILNMGGFDSEFSIGHFIREFLALPEGRGNSFIGTDELMKAALLACCYYWFWAHASSCLISQGWKSHVSYWHWKDKAGPGDRQAKDPGGSGSNMTIPVVRVYSKNPFDSTQFGHLFSWHAPVPVCQAEMLQVLISLS